MLVWGTKKKTINAEQDHGMKILCSYCSCNAIFYVIELNYYGKKFTRATLSYATIFISSSFIA